jgi:biopolymer transport protein ExbD
MGKRSRIFTPSPHAWRDALAARIVQCAARTAPRSLSERLEEEWLAAVSEQPASTARLSFALGCLWAAAAFPKDPVPVSAPVACAAAGGGRAMASHAYYPVPLFSRRSIVARDGALCEINTTPLIDVMLVLLVTLIMTLPIMTHAVKLDLPQTRSSQPPLEVIELEIDFDGTVAWNGTPVASLEQLEGYLRAEAQRDPQPEIHLRADRRAKYDVVAKVLALAQHNRIRKLGFADTGEFRD